MRTFIAAIVALAAVAAAVWVGLDLLQPRISDSTTASSPDQQAQAAADDFATAWAADDVEAMAALVHGDDRAGLDEFLAVSEQMTTALGVEQVSLDIDAIGEGEKRRVADATLTITMDLAAQVEPLPSDTASPGQDPSGTPGTGTAPATTAPGEATAATPATDPADEDTVQVSWPTQVALVERQAGWLVVPDRTTVHPGMRRDTLFARTSTEPVRASILDINGTPLTSHAELVTLGIVPGQLGDRAQLETVWGEVLPNSQAQLLEVVGKGSLVDDWYYPVVSISQDDAARAWPRLRTLPGVTRRDFDGTTTGSTFGSHVLGQVALPTAEQIEQLDATEGEPTGVSGLELALNDRLEGSSRTAIAIIDDLDGTVVQPIHEFQSSDSGPVATSLDADVQRAIESALLGVSDPVAIVAVRADGGIAGAASRPVDGFNRAFEGQYAPGDAITPMTSISLAASGAGMDDAVDCPARAVVAGAAMEAPGDLGLVDLRTAIAAGCDTSVAQQVNDLEPNQTSTALAMGFDQDPMLPLPTTVPTWVEPIDATEAVRAAVGQGRVLATPLLIATMGAEAIADADLSPWLLQEQAISPAEATIDLGPFREVVEAGLGSGGSGAGLLPASTGAPPQVASPEPTAGSTPATAPATTPAGTPPATTSPDQPTPSTTATSAPTADPSARAAPTAMLLGAISGTGSSTGSGDVHSWVLATVGDLGIAVLVEDSEGSMELARALMQRVDRELVELRN
ncbi:MAG TPA: hypothetical protein VJ978_04515 [Nitriliruptoraceae bacterium]|nr:hypothetical protein [Nitriliruptoraceae bacterium]